MQNLPKTYDQSKEDDIYKLWEISGYFNPDNLQGDPFTIIMPPVNANGRLHVGHSLFVTLEDIMIRFERMRGRKTLWLPGTDHAGFETQVVFDKKLEKEGRSRFKMTRKEFYYEVMAFVQENKHFSEEGLRRLGASCDWSRNTFTLDPAIIKIVYETFKTMVDDGLVYRGARISNWCVKHQTTLADLETNYLEQNDPLYYITYGPFTLATVRPETKFGDTALAVNPNDERYKQYIGKVVEAEGLLGSFKIKVIADEAVDMSFGTGVVKVTPAHDAADFEIWQRHKNEIPGPLQVIDKTGKLDLTAFKDNPKSAKYHGLKIKDARKIIVEDLSHAGLLVKIDQGYKHNVQLCYKCSNIIEPLIVPQWYVAMTKPVKDGKSLRDLAVDAIKSKEIKIYPERQEKILMHWMENLKDWAISRQIWWGIPIPVKYCTECSEITIDIEGAISNCPRCSSSKIEQDPDTFDTWFSSGQWPYATLMAKSEEDFKSFYPTDVMETGYDIIFFWVARMIMFGLYRTGKIPFKTVYLHGLVRDKDRQKMSKSKGNVIDPLGVIDQYGVDALRMALVVGNLPGNDLPLSEDKVRGYRNFANKIWNASRFVLQNLTDFSPTAEIKLSAEDQKIVDEVLAKGAEITKLIEQFDFAHAAEGIYHFFWHRFADEIIEQSKANLENEETRKSTQKMLHTILETQLKLLHPFVPFVTEAVWQLNHTQLLMIEQWPVKK
jgi:valyl-tRNA synthetase